MYAVLSTYLVQAHLEAYGVCCSKHTQPLGFRTCLRTEYRSGQRKQAILVTTYGVTIVGMDRVGVAVRDIEGD